MIAVNQPFVYYSLLASAMTACIYLFVSVKLELTRMEHRTSRRLQDVESATNNVAAHAASVETKLAGWTGRLRALEDNLEVYSQRRPESVSRAGIDMNQRTQVMRRTKRGERPEVIAVELGIPRNEVDLLVKVHRALVRSF